MRDGILLYRRADLIINLSQKEVSYRKEFGAHSQKPQCFITEDRMFYQKVFLTERKHLLYRIVYSNFNQSILLTMLPNDERTGDSYVKRQPFCRGNVEWKWCSTAG